MNTQLKLFHHYHPTLSSTPISLTSITKPSNLTLSYTHYVLHTPPLSLLPHKPISPSSFPFKVSTFSLSYHHNQVTYDDGDDGNVVGGLMELEDLDPDSQIYQNTLRLVECSMFASVSGLAYLLSNSLSIENYFGCFFALPIVISSMRWGAAAGRKTMVATAMLLLVLSGPVKALTYVLMHGLLGFTMGSLWRLRVSWTSSIFLCTLVRAVGALGYVVVSSFLIRENILALITINVHATLTLIFNSLGFYTVPSMNTIYGIFGTLLLLNCCFLVFLLHILYALFLTRLGMKASLVLPRWLQNAL